MDDHAFWVVRCKTPKCHAVLLLSYIGVYEGITFPPKPTEVPQYLDLLCTGCGIDHRYTLPVDLEWYRTEEPPSLGFQDKLREGRVQ